MEHIRGHNRIDLNNTDNPDGASLGLADESGVHLKSVEKYFCRVLKGICGHDKMIFPQEAQKGCPARPQPMKAPET